MSGYVRFVKTGDDRIDKILDAVESAGNKYHHTEGWQDQDDAGVSELDLIQAAANAVAVPVGAESDVFRRDETPPPDDVQEVLAWEDAEHGWTTAYRGGEKRDGIADPDQKWCPCWWAWSYGITANFTWWRKALPAPEEG